MKKFLTIILLIVLTIVLIYCGNKHIKVKTYSINDNMIPFNMNNLKIVHFTDTLLTNDNLNNIDIVANKINALKPDIVFFTGDLLKKDIIINEKEKQTLITALKKITCSLYKYAIIGDNDFNNIALYKEIMTQGNFQVLDNESTYLFYKSNNPIKIIGLSDPLKLDNTLIDEENITSNYIILLTHKPDLVNNLDLTKINLVFAGHFLGGEIRIPFQGGLIKKEGALIYIDDYYKIKNTQLYISRGLGVEKLKLRIFNQPSISEYVLVN